MSIVHKGSLATNLDIDCQINDEAFPYVVALSYTHMLNGSRRVAIEFIGHHISEVSPLGSKLTLKVGHGKASHNLDFEGTIYQTRPKINGGTFMATDYVSQLARSELVDYKEQDIIGKDLYYLAADAANYKDVNTDELTEGSGIIATKDMDLAGLMSRKDFIDNCFRYMVEVVSDDYHEGASAVVWRYAIRRNNMLEFFKEDSNNTSIGFKMKVSEKNNNLLGRGIVANIDSSKLVNSATYQSSIDPTIQATVTDEDSVERNGIAGKLYQFKTSRYDRLEELAYQTVLLHKEPTLIYQMQLSNAEHLTLGDYVKVSVPYLKDVILPVVDVRHVIRESIDSYITLGTPEVSISELIKSIT